MGRVTDLLRTPFGFLMTRSKKEEVVAEYVIREHHRGRSLAEILEDPYVTNRLTEGQSQRLLERADILHAVGEDMVAAHRATLARQ